MAQQEMKMEENGVEIGGMGGNGEKWGEMGEMGNCCKYIMENV